MNKCLTGRAPAFALTVAMLLSSIAASVAAQPPAESAARTAATQSESPRHLGEDGLACGTLVPSIENLAFLA